LPRARQFFEGALVERYPEVFDRGVEFAEGEKGMVAQAGENPAFDHLHADLDFGFVAGPPGSGRDNRHPIVL